MIILDLCGGTGAWSAPYKRAGYDVRVVTLPDDVREYIPPDTVHGILAAPPCTMFSLARTRAKTPRDIMGALSIVDACIRLVYRCKPKFWALENPLGLLRKYLGLPRITVNPHDFGDPWAKKTDLWGDFNIPKFNRVDLTDEQKHHSKMNTRPLPDIKGLTTADKRAITPPGFAKAFYGANK